MSEEMLPPAPSTPHTPATSTPHATVSGGAGSSLSSNSGSAPPPSTSRGPRKSHLGLVLGAAVVVFLVMRMMSGSHTSSSSSSSSGDAGTAATDSSAPASSSGNPLIGKWSLEATEDKSFCATHEEFKKDAVIEVKNGASASYAPVYLIKPTYVDVALNGDMQHYGEWDLNGTDEIIFRINSLYVAASCKYQRD